MKLGNHAGGGVDPLACEPIVVPGSPLKNNVPLRIQFLNDCATYERGRVAVGDDLAHVHPRHVKTSYQRMPVGQHFKIVAFSIVTVSGSDGFDVVEVLVQNLVGHVTPASPGERLILLRIVQIPVG